MRTPTKGNSLLLSSLYYEFCDKKGKYSKAANWDEEQTFMVILQHLRKFEKAKMKDFTDLFEGSLNRSQVKYMVNKLVIDKRLKQTGKGSGTQYEVGENFISDMNFLNKALKIGLEHLNENKEL